MTDETGATGQCWLDFLAYLDLLHFEERPLTIVLECMQKLDQNRSVQGRVEKGTLLVIEALKERGYVGQWRKVSPTSFFLPQRRPRVWALFLKVRGGMGPKAMLDRDRDLEEAFNFIKASQTCSHEPLRRLLERIPTLPVSRPTKQARGGQEWRTTHDPNFQRQHRLSDDEVRLGQNEFDRATVDVLSPRQQAGVWLELCKLRKQGKTPNWKQGLFVSDCGSSVGRLSVAKEMFPCVRPGNVYFWS